jgi:hypothetical protein
MSSRDFTKHLVSNTSPINTRVGDEYYDPVSNKLYKKLAVNGTTVTDIEILTSRGSVLADTKFTIIDDVDPSKRAQFDLAGISPNSTVVYSLPPGVSNFSTFVDTQSPQTITGQKTLTNTLKVNNSIIIANTLTANSATMTYNSTLNSIDFYFN